MTLFGRRLLKALSIPDYLIIHKKQPAGRATPGFGNLAQRMLTLIYQAQQTSVLYEQIVKNGENGFPIANKKVIADKPTYHKTSPGAMSRLMQHMS